MRVIFEGNIDGCDYLEIILTQHEWEHLHEGLAKEFSAKGWGKNNLNIFLRKEPHNAIEERKIK